MPNLKITSFYYLRMMQPDARIIIGTMSWGSWGKKLQIKEQAELINFCVEQGNNCFDGADIYGDYTSEQEFGTALEESGIDRNQIQLISKCGIQHVGKSRDTALKHYNTSKEYIVWSAEESLRKLKTEYIDLYLIHRPNPLMHPDEINEAVENLLQGGKIRRFGVSNFSPSQLNLLNHKTAISANQIEFSLTQHTAMNNGCLDQMLQLGIQAMAWSPLGSVFKQNNIQSQRIKEVLAELSIKYELSNAAVLLSWILKHPANCYPIIGTSNKQRIANANKALAVSLELEDWFKLLTASTGSDVA